jgi:hypothetical protein
MLGHRKLPLLLAVAISGMIWATAPSPALADGGPTSGYISPAERARADAKQRQLDQRLASQAKTDAATTATVDYGEVVMSLWQEPQYGTANNWCGPGSTTSVVGQWRGNAVVDNYSGPEGSGPDAYMTRLANTLGEYDGVQTTLDSYVRVTNAEIFSSWYVAVNVGGFTNYQNYLWDDITASNHPLAAVVNGNGLPGWSYNVAHWVTVKQYWVGGDTTTYGDTAGFYQGRNQGAGWYVVSLADFYFNHVQPNTPYSFDVIVW